MPTFHSGVVALVGRPNVGKSTLLNRVVGEKVAIVSPKPQTTRTRILGVVNRPEGQLALVDTPGVHQAKSSLGQAMQAATLGAVEDVDLVLLLVEPSLGKDGHTPELAGEDRIVLERLSHLRKPRFLALNKVDAVAKPPLLPLAELYREQLDFEETFFISARTGEGVEELVQSLLRRLPESDPLFPAETFTDQDERTLAAEFIREQVLFHCREEVPHASAVLVEVFDEADRVPRPGAQGPLQGLIRIAATIYVERESQKAIVIGKKGAMLKAIGTDARGALERMLGTHVYLSLRVKVEPRWRDSERGLRRVGLR
ncbi:MAG: GTPase Era [Myxococcaceae bacterium]